MIVNMAFEDPDMRAQLEKMIRPYIDDIASKFGPLIAKGIKEVDFAGGISNAQGELENMLDTKLKTLTPNSVKKMIRTLFENICIGWFFGELCLVVSWVSF